MGEDCEKGRVGPFFEDSLKEQGLLEADTGAPAEFQKEAILSTVIHSELHRAGLDQLGPVLLAPALRLLADDLESSGDIV